MIVKFLESFKKLSNSSKLIASMILVICVISLLVQQTISIKELNANIASEEKLLSSENLRLSNIVKIKNNYPHFQEKLYQLEASIPNFPAEESILASLQETSEETSTDFTKVTFGKVSTGDGLSQISLSISFLGNFMSLLELLDKIKGASRLVRFDGLNLSKDNVKNSLKADIQAVTFYVSTDTKTVAIPRK